MSALAVKCEAQGGHLAEPALLLPELDRLYRTPLIGFFRRRGCAESLAQDLTQDVFLRIVAYQRVRLIHNARGFIFQVAANLLRDVVRSARRVSMLEQAIEATDLDDCVDPITPERIVEARQALEAVAEAFAALDRRTQRIFVLSRIERLRHRDIADHLGLSVSLIEKAVRDARRRLEARYHNLDLGAAM